MKANMKEVAKAEEDFARLQEQRKQLEAILQRIPTSGRVTMEMKQKRVCNILFSVNHVISGRVFC